MMQDDLHKLSKDLELKSHSRPAAGRASANGHVSSKLATCESGSHCAARINHQVTEGRAMR